MLYYMDYIMDNGGKRYLDFGGKWLRPFKLIVLFHNKSEFLQNNKTYHNLKVLEQCYYFVIRKSYLML